jgi:hypothetical protein
VKERLHGTAVARHLVAAPARKKLAPSCVRLGRADVERGGSDVMAKIRRPWTWNEVEKLLNMAQKYPAAQIAAEIGRPTPSVRTKAQELKISCE